MVVEITNCGPEAARKALLKADYHVKLAVLLVDGMKKTEALEALERYNGNLGKALKDAAT